ncbi:MAG TPA: FadR family transcriptional regulator [Firmicutes bacterium]|nr:FadR family transcriptional regulator [Bacillota bacterium]
MDWQGLPGLEPIQSIRLYKQVEERLLQLINAGLIKPGDRLPSEKTLQEQLGISRSVLREALRILEANGLVVSQQGRGRYLRGPEPDHYVAIQKATLGEIYETRLVLEPAVAGWAAERATPEQMARLEKVLARMEHSPRSEADDFPFHLGLAQACGNEFACRQVTEQITLLSRVHDEAFPPSLREMPLGPWVREHRAILEAVQARDAAQAYRLMYEHLIACFRHIKDTPAQNVAHIGGQATECE